MHKTEYQLDAELQSALFDRDMLADALRMMLRNQPGCVIRAHKVLNAVYGYAEDAQIRANMQREGA